MQLNPVLAQFLTPDKRTLTFAAKGVIAMALSLYLAMYMDLERPYWALVSAVFLQMRPESGLVIEKGICQILGTLAGGAAGIAILAGLMPYPDLAVACLALWVGVNAAASTMVHRLNFIYGFAMAGMTASLIVVLVMANATTADSQAVFQVATARMSEIMVGAVCATLVSLLFWPVRVKGVLRDHARNVINQMLAYLDLELDPQGERGNRHQHADAVLASLINLSDDASAVIYEGLEGRRRARAADLLCNKVLSLLAVIQIFGRFRRNHPELLNADLHALLDKLRQGFQAMAATPSYSQAYKQAQQLRRELLHYRASHVAELPIQARLVQTAMELVGDLTLVLKAYDALENSDKTLLKIPSLGSYRDPLVGAITGLRSALVFLIGAGIWIGTASPSAVMLMILPLTFSVMFARLPSPTYVLGRLLLGVLVAVPVALFFVLGLLAQSSGDFEVLILVLAGPFFLGLMALANQRTLPYGLGFCIPFIILTQPGNQMRFAVDQTLSTALAIFVGMSILYWVFKLITAPDSLLMQKRLIRLTARDLAEIGEHRNAEHWFNGRMGDRLMRLSGYEQGNPSGQRQMTDLGLTGLNLGHVSLRLRRQLEGNADPRVRALLRQWQRVLADAYLLAAKGQLSGRFRRSSALLLAAVRKSGKSGPQLELIEGMMERLALTFDRLAPAMAAWAKKAG
ncbi:FUSC family protein [Gallaecimonas kandeliae]|uniref:FUSC family protein n=1 Tax=Gallaecimonas kandeliae TaxID=3029055 RepID=UPI002648EFAC|nr:FUSC family protein [Gallaecimonas kandeliae]WKE65674.1 FUSC family protein [Gallaecimonas kandeliae]